MIADAALLVAQVDYAIPLAAFIVSAAALGYGIFGSGRFTRISSVEQAMSNRVDDLVRQLAASREEVREMRSELRDCSKDNATLRAENYRLLRKIEGLNGGDH